MDGGLGPNENDTNDSDTEGRNHNKDDSDLHCTQIKEKDDKPVLDRLRPFPTSSSTDRPITGILKTSPLWNSDKPRVNKKVTL